MLVVVYLVRCNGATGAAGAGYVSACGRSWYWAWGGVGTWAGAGAGARVKYEIEAGVWYGGGVEAGDGALGGGGTWALTVAEEYNRHLERAQVSCGVSGSVSGGDDDSVPDGAGGRVSGANVSDNAGASGPGANSGREEMFAKEGGK